MASRSLLAFGTLLLPVLLQAQPTAPPRLAAEVRRLQDAALASEEGYRALAYLCDRVGPRLCGSPGYDEAVAWALGQMKAWGLANVRAEKVVVPHWVRGLERAELLAPVRRELRMLGLGMSVPTPPGGLRADVVVVGSFQELAALPDERVKGRIVLFDAPFTSYGSLAQFRFGGAGAVAARGGVGLLVRSVTDASLDTPHTGMVAYAEDQPPVPAAALTLEHAAMLRRMQARGERITLHLEMGCRNLPDAPSANVVGEIPGRERPGEIVLVGGHLDSWDVGQGAQDDGVGCLLSLEAARLILASGLKPRRTVRVVLFANEENGGRGGLAYARDHADELKAHVAAIETDLGNGLAKGFTLDLRPPVVDQDKVRCLALLGALEPLGAGTFALGGSGSDIGPTVATGVPGLGMSHDTTRYWAVHHSAADTFEKVVKGDFQANAARLATLVYLLAEMPERLLPR